MPEGNVAELARRFSVSEVTIRSDLAALADIGALVRVHGGALPPGDSEELPITVKQTLYHAEKVRIATAAAGLIQDGETVILDSGTTTAEIARQIRGLKLRSLNVITNALNIAVAAGERASRQPHHPGRRPPPEIVVAGGAAGRAGAARPAGRPVVPRRRQPRPGHRPHDASRARGEAQCADDPHRAADRGRDAIPPSCCDATCR